MEDGGVLGVVGGLWVSFGFWWKKFVWMLWSFMREVLMEMIMVGVLWMIFCCCVKLNLYSVEFWFLCLSLVFGCWIFFGWGFRLRIGDVWWFGGCVRWDRGWWYFLFVVRYLGGKWVWCEGYWVLWDCWGMGYFVV